MIIFNLDGTLANCEHRRHFVDPYQNSLYEFVPKNNELDWKEGWYCNLYTSPYFGQPWQPNCPAFYEACDQDKPIQHVIDIFKRYFDSDIPIEIWSGRCKSVREKTIKWLHEFIEISYFPRDEYFNKILKMRPIGDNTPNYQLKERWLDERCSCMTIDAKTRNYTPDCYDVDFVFDSDPESIAMWRRRGIFVFDCNQLIKES